jgi:hypothetical protein
VPTAVKNNGLSFALGLASGGPPTSPNVGKMIVKEQRVEGNNIVTRHMGELGTWANVADGNQMDSNTPAWNSDKFGGRQFEWGHWYATEVIPTSEFAVIRGNPSRTESWVNDVNEHMMEGMLDKFETDSLSTNDSTNRALMGLQFMIDSTGTHGGLNRATAGNEDFQSYTTTISDLTVFDLNLLRTSVYKRGGRAKFGVCGQTPYLKIVQELMGYTLFNDDRWDYFREVDRIGFGGVMHVFAHKGTDTDLFYVDPRGVRLYLDKSLTNTGPIPLTNVKGAHMVWIYDYWLQLIVCAENWCGRIKGIAS